MTPAPPCAARQHWRTRPPSPERSSVITENTSNNAVAPSGHDLFSHSKTDDETPVNTGSSEDHRVSRKNLFNDPFEPNPATD
jgi:hypothetical protein